MKNERGDYIMTQVQYAMCGKKKGYKTQGEALQNAAYQTRKHSPYLRTYKCPYCGKYHITHQRLEKENGR